MAVCGKGAAGWEDTAHRLDCSWFARWKRCGRLFILRQFSRGSAFPILATQAGFVEHLVKLNDKVEPGQKVAIQRNSFGEVVADYTSRVAGEVAGLRSDVTSEPGNPLTFILFHKATPDGVETYPE